jgi:alpha-methylacyl-CoA racemase
MGPLAGIRIIELAGIGPAPLCAMLLADMGATVLRIDRLEAGPPVLPIPRHLDIVGRGRETLAIDLKRAEGRELLLRLIDDADGLIEGFRPGVAERLGIGPEACHARNPRLVYGRMTGWGQDGPLAQSAGHDINYIALTGALDSMGRAGEGPVPPLNLVGDYGGGTMFLAFGMVCALLERARSGRGQVVDAAMVDGAAVLMSTFYSLRAAGQWNAARGTNLLDSGAPFYDVYRCADGRYLSVGALEPKFFAELARLIGLEERFIRAQYDRALWPELRAALTAIFAAQPQAHWAAVLEGTDGCAMPVLSLDEAPLHPHNADRGTFVRVGEAWHPAPAPRFSRTPGAPPQAPGPEPDPGTLLGALGYAADEIAGWRAAGIIRGSEP